MSDETASFHINLSSGEIAFSGSEEFVISQIEDNRAVIDQMLDSLTKQSVAEAKSDESTSESTAESTDNPYPNVFSVIDDELRIIADIPSKSDKSGTEKTVILYVYGKEELMNSGKATVDEIKSACIEQGCYNSNNHSRYVKSADVVTSGSGKSQFVKLTHPGRTAAEKLAKELNSPS